MRQGLPVTTEHRWRRASWPCFFGILIGGPLPLIAQTYENPILDRMADPHVIRVGTTYYLYPTSRSGGYDCWTSQDLVHWTHAGRVFDDPRGGAWAPDVFHDSRRDGKYYLYYTVNDPNTDPGPLAKQIGVAVSEQPTGPFRDHGSLCHPAIDAHLFQDRDGQCYLYYVDLQHGFRIMAQPMHDPLTKSGAPVEVLHPTEAWEKASGHVTEGPFMVTRKGVYYLMYSGTGADSPNYGIGYATARSPLGPFQKYPGNPIVSRRGGVFGPGHHSVVEGPAGQPWLIYHQKYDDRINFRRFLAIDPLHWSADGVLSAQATRGTAQPAP